MRKTCLFTGAMALCLLALCACGGGGAAEPSAPTYEEQYALGVQYLSEGNYQEAILAFTAAIEIDPKQAPAYVGRGDAYVGVASLTYEGGLPPADTPAAEAPQGETAEYYGSAEADYLAALGLDRLAAEIYHKLANVYLLLAQPERAMEILVQGFEATGDQFLEDLRLSLAGDSGSAGHAGLPRFGATVTSTRLEPPLEGHNEGSAGQMAFNYTWDTGTVPAGLDIYTALIGTWSTDGFSVEEIEAEAAFYEAIWKDEGSLWQDYPNSGGAFPVWAEDLGTTQQVLLYALNGDGGVVGYLILPVTVPAA